jgi:hypothetical protein
MRILLSIVGAALLLGCAGGGGIEADRAALSNARPVGEPTDCVTLSSISRTRVRDDRTIDFFLRDGRVFRNRLRHHCAGLGFEESFSYETSLPRLCSVDMIRVRTPSGLQGGTCGLGSFQQIEIAGR